MKMTIIHNCKSLISHAFKNYHHPSHHLHKPHFCSAFSLFFSSFSTQKQLQNPNPISDYLVSQHQFSHETATKAASALAHLKTPEKCDFVLSYLKEIGFSKTHLENVVISAPHVLCASLDQTIKPKIKIFQDLGFSVSDMVDIISVNPWMLMHSADNRIMPSLLVLKNVFGSVDGVAKVLKVSAWFFKYDLEKTLLPNIEYMKSCGISTPQLINHIYNFPRFFLNRPESVRKYVDKVDEMGFDKNNKLYLYAITAVGSMSVANWEHKLELFRSLGFSEDDIFAIFRRKPQVFAVSERKIKEVIRVVLDTGKYGISDIVRHPGVFLSSVERTKPRLKYLEILENRNLLKRQPGFWTLYVIPDKKFIEKFVSPYSIELGAIYLSRRGLLGREHSGMKLEV